MTDNDFTAHPGLAQTEGENIHERNLEVLTTALGGEENPMSDATMSAIIERGRELEEKMKLTIPIDKEEDEKPQQMPQPKGHNQKKKKGRKMLAPLMEDTDTSAATGARTEIAQATPVLPPTALKRVETSPDTPKAKDPQPDRESSPPGEEWHDVPAVSDVTTDAPEGDQDQLYGDGDPVASLASSYAQDMRRDVDEVATRIATLHADHHKTATGVEEMRILMSEIRTSNSQFQTDIMNRLRALERKLEHDPSVAQKSSAVATAIRKTEGADDKKQPEGTTRSAVSFADRLRAKKNAGE